MPADGHTLHVDRHKMPGGTVKGRKYIELHGGGAMDRCIGTEVLVIHVQIYARRTLAQISYHVSIDGDRGAGGGLTVSQKALLGPNVSP